MIPFALELIADVEDYLSEVNENSHDVITKTKKSIYKVKVNCDKLNHKLIDYQFSDLEEEIRFFKEVKPLLFSKLIYHRFILKLEVSQPEGAEEIRRSYFIKYLNKIAKFFRQNKEFYNYYVSKHTNFDDKYFTKCKNLKSNLLYESNEDMEIMFSSHDLYIARIIAYTKVEEYIINELQKTFANYFEPVSDSEKLQKLKGLRWTAPQIDLIELIYGLHRRKCINNGEIAIKTLVEGAEVLFGIKIKDVYRVYADIKSRHHRTKFLDSLRDSLDKSIDEDDF